MSLGQGRFTELINSPILTTNYSLQDNYTKAKATVTKRLTPKDLLAHHQLMHLLGKDPVDTFWRYQGDIYNAGISVAPLHSVRYVGDGNIELIQAYVAGKRLSEILQDLLISEGIAGSFCLKLFAKVVAMQRAVWCYCPDARIDTNLDNFIVPDISLTQSLSIILVDITPPLYCSRAPNPCCYAERCMHHLCFSLDTQSAALIANFLRPGLQLLPGQRIWDHRHTIEQALDCFCQLIIDNWCKESNKWHKKLRDQIYGPKLTETPRNRALCRLQYLAAYAKGELTNAQLITNFKRLSMTAVMSEYLGDKPCYDY